MGLKSRTKGRAFEQRVARWFREQVYTADKSSVIRGWWQSRGGSLVPDVSTPHFWVECGHQNHVDGAAKLAQAIRYVNTIADPRFPIAVVRKTGSRVVEVVMRLGDLWMLTLDEHPLPEDGLGREVPTPVFLCWKFWVELAENYVERQK